MSRRARSEALRLCRLAILVAAAVIGGAVLIAGGGAAAPGGAPVRLVVDGPIVELKAEGSRAILLVGPTAWTDGPYCADGLVWSPATRAQTPLFSRSSCNPAGAYLAASFGVALTQRAAAWIASDGGNGYDTILRVASPATATPQEVDRGGAGGQGYSGTFVVNPHADGELLVYNRFARCQPAEYQPTIPCPRGYAPGSITSDTVLRALPGSRRPIATSTRALTVLAVGGGLVVARQEAGPLIVLSTPRA
jgi:hypothetical protein